MKVIVQKSTPHDAKYLMVNVPVRYEEEDMPKDFPGREGQYWTGIINIETGEWGRYLSGGEFTHVPEIKASMFMKVADEGNYQLLDKDGEIIAEALEEYVPNFMPGDHHGDYLILEFDNGKVTNWRTGIEAEVQAWVDKFAERS